MSAETRSDASGGTTTTPVAKVPLVLHPGDVFFSRSGTRLGRAIRYFQRLPGEPESKVNHTGLIVFGDRPYTRCAMSIEALHKVRYGGFRMFYGPPEGRGIQVAIYRDLTLDAYTIHRLVSRAMTFEHRRYGYRKLGLHLLDYWLALAFRRDVYFFRRLSVVDRYPICSYIVAHSYSAVGRNFGVAPGQASPDDILDYIEQHPDKWECVHPLQELREASTLEGDVQ